MKKKWSDTKGNWFGAEMAHVTVVSQRLSQSYLTSGRAKVLALWPSYPSFKGGCKNATLDKYGTPDTGLIDRCQRNNKTYSRPLWPL